MIETILIDGDKAYRSIWDDDIDIPEDTELDINEEE